MKPFDLHAKMSGVITVGPSPSEPQQLEEMAASLENLFVVLGVERDAHDGDFAPDAPARVLWSVCQRKHARALQEGYRTGVVRWHSIQDHASGFIAAIRGGLSHSCLSLARSMAEGAARSWHNLDRGASELDIVERLINDRLYADHENLRLYRGLLPSPSHSGVQQMAAAAKQSDIRDRIARVEADMVSLKRDAKHYGIYGLSERKNHAPYVGSRGRPEAMGLIAKVVGASTSDPFFRISSAIDHGSLHGMVRMFAFYPADDGRMMSRPRQLTPDDLVGACAPAVQTVVSAAAELFFQSGWDDKKLDLAFQRIARAWNPPLNALSIREYLGPS